MGAIAIIAAVEADKKYSNSLSPPLCERGILGYEVPIE